MLSIINILSGSKFALLLISLISIFTIIDSQFLKVFYGTALGTPGNFHFLLFVSLVIFASVINIMFIGFTKSNDTQARSSRPLLFRTVYVSTFAAQIAVLLIMYLVISEMLIFHAHDRVFLLLVIVLSHFLSAFMLGILSVIFLQWYRFGRSLSILTYALVFTVIIFVILTTLSLLVETHSSRTVQASNWPVCIKKDVTVDNRSVVFLGNPAFASTGGANANAMSQACQISSSQLLYLVVNPGECSQGEAPGKSIPQLLSCARDENKVIKLIQAKVDGMDVSSNIVRETTSQPYLWIIRSPDNAFNNKIPCCGEAMAEMYDLLFKPLPVGHHTITVEVIRVPLQPSQPVEHDLAKWDINVV